MNNPQSRAAALAMAERLLATHPAAEEGQLRGAWRGAVGRSPTATELAEGLEFVRSQAESYASPVTPESHRQALADYCQALFCLNEFIYID